MGSRESGERGEGGHGKHKGVVIEVKILLTLPPTVTRPTTVPSDPSGYTQHSLPHPHSDVQPRSHPPHDSTANDSMLRPPQRFLSGTRAFKQLINCYRTSRGFLFIQSCIQTLFFIQHSQIRRRPSTPSAYCPSFAPQTRQIPIACAKPKPHGRLIPQ